MSTEMDIVKNFNTKEASVCLYNGMLPSNLWFPVEKEHDTSHTLTTGRRPESSTV